MSVREIGLRIRYVPLGRGRINRPMKGGQGKRERQWERQGIGTGVMFSMFVNWGEEPEEEKEHTGSMVEVTSGRIIFSSH